MAEIEEQLENFSILILLSFRLQKKFKEKAFKRTVYAIFLDLSKT